MANSKAGSKRPASTRSARTVAAVSHTPTSAKATRPAAKAAAPEPEPAEPTAQLPAAQPRPSEQPLWLQVTTLVLAVIGLAISAYETYAHFNGNHLAGCPTGGGGTFNCTAVITSSQSMVFGVIPVAVLGLAFYVAAVPLFSPWAWRVEQLSLGGWRISRRQVGQLRLASAIVGMGFVMYLIFAEFQIGSICEYCTGVHIVTFLLFCITVFSAAIWGFGDEDRAASGRRR
jgi:uncharacterized membrane protein